MMFRRFNWSAVGLILILTLGLFQYQNCANPQGMAHSFSDDGEVRIIDDYFTGIAFVQTKIFVEAEKNNQDIFGFCERKSSEVVTWKLGRPAVREGSVVCQNGGFHIVVENVDGLSCNIAYAVFVKSASGFVDEMSFMRVCN